MTKKLLNFFIIGIVFLHHEVNAKNVSFNPTLNTYQEICQTEGIRSTTTTLRGMCEIIVKSKTCQSVPKKDLLLCNEIEKPIALNSWDYIKGCAKGALNSVKETLEFLWSIMELVWDGDKRGNLAAEASEFMGMAKLYLHTEYQKALAKSSPPMKETKALMAMGGAIGSLVLDKVSELVANEYDEFGCLNSEAKSKYLCKILGDVFIPPAGIVALIKVGPKLAMKHFPHLKKAAAPPKTPQAPSAPKTLFGQYPNLKKTIDGISIRGGVPIEHPREMPFENTNQFRPVKDAEMRKRADELPPNIQKTVVGVYNTLGDKKVLETYFKGLVKESAEWMAKRGRPADLELLKKGVVSEHAMSVILIKRFKASGDNQFTTMMPRSSDRTISVGAKNIKASDMAGDNDAFRTAIRTGPFLDRVFESKAGNRYGHGVINHMIQRDIVKDVVKKEMKGNPQEFYNYLGSKKGVNWWSDLFDSGEGTRTFTRPENISEFMHHNVTEGKFRND